MTRNQVYRQRYRGFESHPLRQTPAVPVRGAAGVLCGWDEKFIPAGEIPPTTPILCRKCLNCQVRFRHFLLLFSSFEPTDIGWATFLPFSPIFRGEIIGENGRLFCLCDAKAREHCICGVQLGAVVQMGVNIGCGRKIAVTKPFLNLLHRNPVCEHQAGARVPIHYNNVY